MTIRPDTFTFTHVTLSRWQGCVPVPKHPVRGHHSFGTNPLGREVQQTSQGLWGHQARLPCQVPPKHHAASPPADTLGRGVSRDGDNVPTHPLRPVTPPVPTDRAVTPPVWGSPSRHSAGAHLLGSHSPPPAERRDKKLLNWVAEPWQPWQGDREGTRKGPGGDQDGVGGCQPHQGPGRTCISLWPLPPQLKLPPDTGSTRTHHPRGFVTPPAVPGGGT